MALRRLWVRNYRSLVDVALEPARLTVLVGENGSGKTNLYRALRLLCRGAEGRLATTLLEEGGMPSVLFAGERPRRKERARPHGDRGGHRRHLLRAVAWPAIGTSWRPLRVGPRGQRRGHLVRETGPGPRPSPTGRAPPPSLQT
ncbi:MAG: AAA family ATPase [Acidimicrobiales bacterium]